MSSKKSKSPSPTKLKDLPPNAMKTIISKLNFRDAASLALTDKENLELLKSYSFKDKKILLLQQGLIPYTESIQENLEKYEDKYKEDIKTDKTPYIKDHRTPRPPADIALQNMIKSDSKIFKVKNEKKLDTLCKLLDVDASSYKQKIKDAVVDGLKYSNKRTAKYNKPAPDSPNININRVKSEKELYEFITAQVGREYEDVYYEIITKIRSNK
jgi:hypothetical protein